MRLGLLSLPLTDSTRLRGRPPLPALNRLQSHPPRAPLSSPDESTASPRRQVGPAPSQSSPGRLGLQTSISVP
ncbi:hypothetical protein CUMW_148240 [Citrus unshiu]|uniref:Uncharacterized protein n=1 Tax=Citrus unshiu TaxID=55188 RepID=A0A2H5PLT6_CITUN|nr:hypothetical protein CUMW_148240 [Citrus unshiu]